MANSARDRFKLLMSYIETAKGYEAGTGWKHIIYLHLHETPMFNLKNMIDKNLVEFIDDSTGWTGFVITDIAPVEYRVFAPVIQTFISVEDIQSISFDFGESNYNEIYSPTKDIFNVSLMLRITFEHDTYYFDNVHDAIMGIKYTIADPCDVTIGVWSSKSERDAATDTTGSIPLQGKGVYYFKAFARGQDGAVVTDTCTVYIGIEPDINVCQFFTSEGHAFYTVDGEPFYVQPDEDDE